MRNTFVCAGFGLALAVASSAFARPILQYGATLDGTQQNPDVVTPATGTGTMAIDTDANTMTINVVYSGLIGAQTDQHIHGFSGPEVNSSVIFPLPAGGSPINAVWNFTEAQQANILAGLTYVNIHTTFAGGGEIRGQILPVPEPASLGVLAIAGIAALRRRR
ncbi:MAG: CHRD domain-containing protein [Anaerolineae bacterium]|nr:CHRD domain-containing protein [Phycisphaerae bacterium]